MKTTSNKFLSYFLIILAIAIVAGLGSLFVNLGMEWFSLLQTPSQFPPNFIIPIVWSVIYILFAICTCPKLQILTHIIILRFNTFFKVYIYFIVKIFFVFMLFHHFLNFFTCEDIFSFLLVNA